MTDRPSSQQRVKDRVDLALGWFLTGLMALAVLNVLWQVFTRYVLEDPSAYTDELARYLLVWIGLVGAGYAAGKRMHLAIDLLPQRLKGRSRHGLNLGIDVLIFLFALFVMFFGGIRLVALTLMLEQTSAALRIPLGYVYLALPLSGALIMFYAVLHMTDHLRLLRGEEPALHESERSSAAALAEEVHETETLLSGREAGVGGTGGNR